MSVTTQENNIKNKLGILSFPNILETSLGHARLWAILATDFADLSETMGSSFLTKLK
jgi:hypothetical protein